MTDLPKQTEITEFMQRVLDAVPYFPGEIHIVRVVNKIYGNWESRRKQRGRKAAVSKALWKLYKLGEVGWRRKVFGFRENYWFRKK